MFFAQFAQIPPPKFIVKKMCICHKFVKEYFIFVVAFTQIRSKQALDESRSQFAVFAAPCTCVIPYGQNSAERTFLSYHKSLNLYRRKIELLFFFYPASRSNSVASTPGVYPEIRRSIYQQSRTSQLIYGCSG